MSRDRTRIAWRRRAVVLSLLGVTFGFGCSPASLAWLFKGDGKQPAPYPLAAKEDKDEVTVAIFTTPSPTMGIDFAGADRQLAQLVGAIMTAETAKEKHKVRVIDQSKVERLKNTPGRDWRTANPAVLGKELGADYVLDITVNSMSMNQAEFGGEFYQGRANLQVVVYDVDHPETPMTEYPVSVQGDEVGAGATSAMTYRKKFLEQHLARTIANYHVAHPAVMGAQHRR